MSYKILFTKRADREYKDLQRSGMKSVVAKATRLLLEMKDTPRSGGGKPEILRHYPGKEVWSRRLDKKNRMVYEIRDSEIIVLVLSVTGHYDDK